MFRRILWLVLVFCLQAQTQYIYEPNQPLYHLQTNAGAFEGELAYEIADDGISPAIDFSFNFNFYGNTFDSARIATNGCLHFGLTSTAYADYCGDYTPDPLPGYKNTLYPFWTDLIRDSNSRIKSYGDSSKMIFGWYDMREFNRSGSDNSFEIILWSNHTFEYRYGELDINNHDVLIGEQGPDSNKIYTYLYHDECNTGTTISSSCVNTDWNNTSFNTSLENGGSLYSDGSDHSIDCSNPLNSSSCAGYADALLNQQCNLSQLYSTSCPNYDDAYDELQCEEDPQYRPFCSGYRQEESVAFFQEDDMNFGGQRNDGQHEDMFGHDDIFSNEDFLLGIQRSLNQQQIHSKYKEIVFFCSGSNSRYSLLKFLTNCLNTTLSTSLMCFLEVAFFIISVKSLLSKRTRLLTGVDSPKSAATDAKER